MKLKQFFTCYETVIITLKSEIQHKHTAYPLESERVNFKIRRIVEFVALNVIMQQFAGNMIRLKTNGQHGGKRTKKEHETVYIVSSGITTVATPATSARPKLFCNFCKEDKLHIQ
jgi:hypothetical protein